ncbi:MAG: type II secretion system F family protein, partial [Otoolea sp.]
AAGEETGSLSTMLFSAAEYYEKEAAFQTEKGAAALEPLLVLGMALLVSLVLAAVFSPMLTMYEKIQYL